MQKDSQEPLSRADELRIIEAITNELNLRPPTIGLIGVSGVGKSSTINSMFKTALPISHVVACTKEFRDTDLQVTMQSGKVLGHRTHLRVIDAPGLGEDINLDPDYITMYRQHLDRCDVILWVLAARNRAVALEQHYLQQLHEFTDRMVFGINQVDLVEPLDWNVKINLPSLVQERNIDLIVTDRRSKIEAVIGREVEFVPYSAKYMWNLQELFTILVESCPPTRSWIFSGLKAFKPEDFLPEDVREAIWKKVNEHENPGRKR